MTIKNNVLISAPEGKDLVVPEGVERFSEEFLEGKLDYQSIYLPHSIKEFPIRLMKVATDLYYAGTFEEWKKVKFITELIGSYNLNFYVLNEQKEYVPLEEIKISDQRSGAYFFIHEYVRTIKRIIVDEDTESASELQLRNRYYDKKLDIYYPGSFKEYIVKRGLLFDLYCPYDLYFFENGQYVKFERLNLDDYLAIFKKNPYADKKALRNCVSLKEIVDKKFKAEKIDGVTHLFFNGDLEEYIHYQDKQTLELVPLIMRAYRLHVLNENDYQLVDKININKDYSDIPNLLSDLRDTTVYLSPDVTSFKDSIFNNSLDCSLYFDGTKEEFLNIKFNKRSDVFSGFQVYVKNENNEYEELNEIKFNGNKNLFNIPGRYKVFDFNKKFITTRGFFRTMCDEVIFSYSKPEIGEYAFEGSLIGCLKLSNITNFPNGAFCNIGLLKKIYLPKTLDTIGWGVFHSNQIEEVYYEGDVCDYTQINIKDGASYTSRGAMDYQSIPTLHAEHVYFKNGNGEYYEPVNIDLGSNVPSIKDFTIFNYPKLESLRIHSSCQEIGYMAIASNKNLKDIYFSGQTRFNKGAIRDNNRELSIHFEGDMEKWISRDTNEGENPKQYTDNFYIDGNLIDKDLYINKGAIIKPFTFEYFDKVISLTIGDTVTDIKKNAFFYLKNLERVFFGKNVKSIENYAFNGCDNIEFFDVDKENPYFYSVNNVVISKKDNKVILKGKNVDDSLIPADTKPTLYELVLGSWPASVVNDESLIAKLNKTKAKSDRGFILLDGQEYQKLKVKDEREGGEVIYYRDGSPLKEGTAYFKVEPIVWKLVEEREHEYLFVASEIIEAYPFGKCDYRESKMRNHLINEVLPVMFSIEEQTILNEISQTNYVETRGKESYEIKDKMVLPTLGWLRGEYLTEKEAENIPYSDFALAKNQWTPQVYFTSTMIRGGYIRSNEAHHRVALDPSDYFGVRPFICVSKEALEKLSSSRTYKDSFNGEEAKVQKIIYFFNYWFMKPGDSRIVTDAVTTHNYQLFMKMYKKYEKHLNKYATVWDDSGDDIIDEIDITIEENFMKITSCDSENG